MLPTALNLTKAGRRIQSSKSHAGCFVRHACGGQLTRYMSEEWFAAIRASIRTAKKHGMMA